ncbi:carotenoid biosynthesis protein [Alkalibacillus almallahensis]|uniref:carotenoid biosynthesis protein n=1 Tax=Alkalibacillus almallahensis TaxID=1379154 RepID=UPI00141D7A5B|nr:carotenoid biosynthesis protein [Alkalibacillus almallahensis]NIK11393.1 putative membrane protein [Alkalibacillus almallahensis]
MKQWSYIAFIVWMNIGFVLMFFWEVPEWLNVSNSIFLFLFALSTVALYDLRLRNFYAAAAIGLITYLVEVIGVATGFPFGTYEYTDTLGFLVFGVPVTLGFAWIGVIYVSLFLSRSYNRWIRSLQVGFWVIVIDAILDPAATVLDFWEWEHSGLYFGIPITNFIAWFLLAFGVSLLVPQKAIANRDQQRGVRLFQFIILFFGLLSLKEGLTSLWVMILIALALSEGWYRYDRTR